VVHLLAGGRPAAEWLRAGKEKVNQQSKVVQQYKVVSLRPAGKEEDVHSFTPLMSPFFSIGTLF
jgi:hypothetical protein